VLALQGNNDFIYVILVGLLMKLKEKVSYLSSEKRKIIDFDGHTGNASRH